MTRRRLVTAAAAMGVAPAVARAQRVRVVGVLLSQAEGTPEAVSRVTALRDGLLRYGWVEGQNLRLDVRYGDGTPERLRQEAMTLVAEKPDLLVASATSALAALQKATTQVPIVFAQVTDPVGAGFVKSLAKPGGNITGFTQHEFSIGLKWLELLEELAPNTRTVSVLYDPQNPATAGYRAEIFSGAGTFQAQVVERPAADAAGIEAAVRAAGQASGNPPSGGLIVLPGPSLSVRPEAVVDLVTELRLPAVYPFRYWVKAGGLAFYGIDNIDLHRQAAIYVDRILNGARPGQLPVQNATRFELVINLKAARAIGLTVPPSVMSRADELID
ncbi:MAG: ABC transporter substrate-binding protein [Proteobacteria bacterium]|nr:ABC transporter substrate-binding protein [Pseudomonadota bacterium]